MWLHYVTFTLGGNFFTVVALLRSFGASEELACHSVALAKDGWGTWIRTMADGFKGRCPTTRRSPKDEKRDMRNGKREKSW